MDISNLEFLYSQTQLRFVWKVEYSEKAHFINRNRFHCLLLIAALLESWLGGPKQTWHGSCLSRCHRWGGYEMPPKKNQNIHCGHRRMGVGKSSNMTFLSLRFCCNNQYKPYNRRINSKNLGIFREFHHFASFPAFRIWRSGIHGTRRLRTCPVNQSRFQQSHRSRQHIQGSQTNHSIYPPQRCQ